MLKQINIVIVTLIFATALSKPAMAQADPLLSSALDPNFPVDKYSFGENNIFWWFAGSMGVELMVKDDFRKTLSPAEGEVKYFGFDEKGNSYISVGDENYSYNSKVNANTLTKISSPRPPSHLLGNMSGPVIENTSFIAGCSDGYKLFVPGKNNSPVIYDVYMLFMSYLDSATQDANVDGGGDNWVRPEGDKVVMMTFNSPTDNYPADNVSSGTLEVDDILTKAQINHGFTIESCIAYTKRMAAKKFGKKANAKTSNDAKKENDITEGNVPGGTGVVEAPKPLSDYNRNIPNTPDKDDKEKTDKAGENTYVEASVTIQDSKYVLSLAGDNSRHVVFRPLAKGYDTAAIRKFNESIGLDKGGWAEMTKDKNGKPTVTFYTFDNQIERKALIKTIPVLQFRLFFFDPK